MSTLKFYMCYLFFPCYAFCRYVEAVEVVLTSDKFNLLIGESVNLTCNANVTDTKYVSWKLFKNDTLLATQNGTATGQFQLKINDILTHLYCEATNHSTVVLKSQTILIQARGSIVKLNNAEHNITHTYIQKININGNVKKGFFMKSIFTEKHTYTN